MEILLIKRCTDLVDALLAPGVVGDVVEVGLGFHFDEGALQRFRIGGTRNYKTELLIQIGGNRLNGSDEKWI